MIRPQKRSTEGALLLFCYDEGVIYFFYGSDVEKVREKAFAWVAAARTKEPQLAYVRLAREEMTEASLEEAALSGGLFVKRLLIVLDDPFPSARNSDVEEDEDITSPSPSLLEEKLDQLAASDNAILIVAPKLALPKAKKISAKAAKEYRFDRAAASSEVRGFNTNLVNALSTRHREKLWVEILRALQAGDAPEAIHGLLHWKARDIMEKGTRAWKPQEARALSLHLIKILQESRRKNVDLSESLERFALSV